MHKLLSSYVGAEEKKVFNSVSLWPIIYWSQRLRDTEKTYYQLDWF